MNDDWEKRAKELPHYKPAHVTQNKNLDDFINSVPGMPPVPRPQHQSQQQPGGHQDINGDPRLFDIIQKRQQQQQSQQQVSSNVVSLREGCQFFRALQIQVPANVLLAANAGPLSGVSGREFKFEGIRKYYILENQHDAVDLAKIDQSKLINLAVVSAPFIGTLLVPESAIIRQQNGGMQLLKG